MADTENSGGSELNGYRAPSYGTDIGLSKEEVDERISKGLVNGDTAVKTKSIPHILASNIFTFFNFVFVVLAVLLTFFIDWDWEGIGNFGFIILVFINCATGIVQEISAKRTIDRLSLISAPKVTVLRDGKEEEIAVKDILLDDLTLLSAGDQICADSVVLEGSIEVNESLITGEPDAILKHPGDEITSGSYVVSGKAKAAVRHIGMDNFAAKINAGAKYYKKPNSEIVGSLMFIVKIMAVAIIPLGIALFCVKHFAWGRELNVTAINTIATVVNMIPSGLVALSTAVFCISVVRLAKRKTLAQDMYCVETLARVDVLCLDKTGTITEGTMEVNGIEPHAVGEEEMKADLKRLVYAIGDDNTTAAAIMSYVGAPEGEYGAETVVPFSSARKWSGARFDGKTYVLGAPEFVFPGSTDALISGRTSEMAEQGFRVLALAVSAEPFEEQTLPGGLKLAGFVFITDKIRKEAPDTLKFFREQGVGVKIISGDNPKTVRAVAQRAGVEDCDSVIDMSTLSTEEEIYEAAEKYTIFGRVLPDQKLALIKAFKKNGHTVAMTGDGVNDVLALKEADCSVAMASGSDAAKNVSSLILLDSNFASMPRVVAEGRRSINNLERSASLFLVKTMYMFLFSILFMVVNSDLPFAPRHLTLINGVTIGIPSFILALEPNNKRVTGRFLPKVMATAVPGAITVFLGACAILICEKLILTELNFTQIQNLYLIVTTFIGFLFLFKVCLPFNVIHTVLYLALLGIFAGAFAADIPELHALFGISRDFTWEMGKAILSICAAILPVYIALTLSMKPLGAKAEAWLDAKNIRFDRAPEMRLFNKKQK